MKSAQESLYRFAYTGQAEFYDCDPMGVVWHGNYLKYLEAARGRFFELAHYPYKVIYQEGHTFPVAELKLKYKSPLFLKDDFTVITDLLEYENRLVFNQEVRRGDTVCLRARSVQVCVPNGAGELSFFMPENFIRNVRELIAESGVPEEG
ncbi:acyl-CoA thioesterase [Succinimonas sp.]|uniref:acyl-CoA thioesterase n=1 Tax=Succinimonas sp. TaxID=1936151 RepID=UPI0038677D94